MALNHSVSLRSWRPDRHLLPPENPPHGEGGPGGSEASKLLPRCRSEIGSLYGVSAPPDFQDGPLVPRSAGNQRNSIWVLFSACVSVSSSRE
jgi:hypothetical protein